MSVTVTQQLTQQTVSVTGNPVENNVVVTVSNARGPEGPEGPSGASTWDEISGTASSIPFEPVTPPAYAEGLVFYDSDDKSLTYYNDEADVSMNLGREMWVRVRNDSGATIANGKVVYINDAQGQLPTIRLARADAEATSRVIGIATHDIENNSNGYVTTSGMVKGINTSAFQDGDLLFLSAATAGEMTTTAPTAPNRAVQVAIVAHAHVSQGKLYCHPENDSVASTGIVDSTSTGRSILTSANAATARAALGSSATGDALFTAATASTARTTLGVGTSDSPTFAGVELFTSTTTTLNAYNVLSGSNFERLAFRWVSNVARIGTAKGGTGTARDLVLETDATERFRITSAGQVRIVTGASGTSGAGTVRFGGGIINTIESWGGTAGGALYIYSEGTIRMLIGGSSGTQIYQSFYPDNTTRTLGLSANRWGLLYNTGINSTGDVEVTDSTKGIILQSPNGTRWRVTVDNGGALTTTAL